VIVRERGIGSGDPPFCHIEEACTLDGDIDLFVREWRSGKGAGKFFMLQRSSSTKKLVETGGRPAFSATKLEDPPDTQQASDHERKNPHGF